MEEQHSVDFPAFSFCLIYARLRAKEASKPEMPTGTDKKSPNKKHFFFFLAKGPGNEAAQQYRKLLESNYSALAKHHRIDCGHFPAPASGGRVRNLELNPCENV